ncbi:hypothetical protein ACPUYX_09910 [Desulfosporosinus sp. SYSU MS00001]|uniref:hypothetical protein n=1 Tax=Desulfosporosinus sp. SYSU MS00001 TaxID=3416284 RepID=UPI003CEF0524
MITDKKCNTNYAAFINDIIDRIPEGDPIFTNEITNILVKELNIDQQRARKIVNTTLNRLNGTSIENFRKGIYYKPKITVFGKTPLNPTQLIFQKYMIQKNDIVGYETGASFLQKIGLATQIPKYHHIVTNLVNHRGNKVDNELKVVLRKPKVKVDAKNVKYLQVLDAVENKDRIPVDAKLPYKIINDYMEKNSLDFGRLIALADTKYPKIVVTRLLKIAQATRL